VNAHELVESKWLVAEEFGLNGIPREPRVTIKDVRKQKVGKENWGVLHFAEEWAKPLKINTTSKRALILMFGEETTAWHGKRLDLFAKPGNYPKGKKVAVRIKGSPDIAHALSFSVQAFGGGEDVYDLMPSGAPKAATPYERMWRAFTAAGNKDQTAFKALIKTSTGKSTPKELLDADVAKFEAALQGPPPPMSDDEKATVEAAERGLEPGAAG
jgi:hypothetical protein